jgi:hypothetical protein
VISTAVDSTIIIIRGTDGSNWYLSLGSFWTGIKLETYVKKTFPNLAALP